MKKLITCLVIASSAILSVPANASSSSDVIGALIIGGLIGNAISENENRQPNHRRDNTYIYPGTNAYPIYVPPPVYTPPPRAWSPNPVYQLMPVYDSSCNCHVMMPVRVR